MSDKLDIKEISLNKKLITAVDGVTIGENFKELTNLRYTDTGLKAIAGMTKINTTALSSYPKIRNMIHFKKDQPAESHVLVQAYNSGETASQVLENTTDIPNQGDFSATVLHTDAAGAGRGRFSLAPDGNVAYCNGAESMIWGGNELRCAGFMAGLSGVEYDYSDIITNTLTDTQNVVDLSKGLSTIFPAYYLIGSTIPLKRIKFYIKTANTASVGWGLKCWDGNLWQGVTNMVDGTSNLTQTGTMSFDDTEAIAKVKEVNGIVLYWYEISASRSFNAVVSHITVGASFQSVKDIWDGNFRDCLSFQLYKNGTYNDNTINVYSDDYTSVNTASFSQLGSLQYSSVGEPTFTGIGLDDMTTGGTFTGTVDTNYRVKIDGTGTPDTFRWSDNGGTTYNAIGVAITGSAQSLNNGVTVTFGATTGHTSNDYWDFTCLVHANYAVAGFLERQMGLSISVVGEAANTIISTSSIYYWGGSAWTAATGQRDGTSEGGVTFAKSGIITWSATDSQNEFTTEIAKSAGFYYYKVAFSANLSADVKVDSIRGIPAQNNIRAYKFPFFAQDRLFLCSDQSDKKNSVICSAEHSSQVFNGDDSTTLEFGDDTELTAAASLYSQFGSSLYNIMVFCKAKETWVVIGNSITEWVQYPASSIAGCIAPLTMEVMDIPLRDLPGQHRQIAIWQGEDDIYEFDGKSPVPISTDIRDIFDKNNANGINQDKITDSIGFYDAQNHEYHFCWAQGTSTTLNKEYVYDLLRHKWFNVDRSTVGTMGIQAATMVIDANGNKHNYGAIDTGYMERLEYGNTFDGTNMTFSIQTGDMAIYKGSIMYETIIRKIKLITAAKTNTTNSVNVTHYGDTGTTGTSLTMSPVKSGYRVADVLKGTKLGPHIFHSIKFSMTTNNEPTGFEPYYLGIVYKVARLDMNKGGSYAGDANPQ